MFRNKMEWFLFVAQRVLRKSEQIKQAPRHATFFKMCFA